LGIGDWAQFTNPNPQSPIPIIKYNIKNENLLINFLLEVIIIIIKFNT